MFTKRGTERVGKRGKESVGVPDDRPAAADQEDEDDGGRGAFFLQPILLLARYSDA